MAFGRSYHLDCYNCTADLDSLELVYRYLEELVNLVGMTSFTPSLVFHGPKDKKGNEIYPDKYGVSGAIFLIESSITIHTIVPQKFISIDLYTCGCLDKDMLVKVRAFTKEKFGYTEYEDHYLERGLKYGNQN